MNAIGEQRSCRACLCSAPMFHSFLEHVAGQSIYDMFATLLPQLQIKPGENGMPELICAICLNKLNIAFQFQQMCLISDVRLHSELLTKVTEVDKTPNLDPLVQIEEKQLISCNTLEELINEENWAVDDTTTNKIVNVKAIWSESDESSLNSTNVRRGRSKSVSKSTNIEAEVNEVEKPNARNRRNGHFPCAECGKDFDRPYRLRRHLSVHSKHRAFACDRCKYRFATAKLLACHTAACNSDEAKEKLVQHHIPPPTAGYKCRECPRRFEKRESLAAHTQAHRKAAPGQLFKCEYCTKVFKKSAQLSKHARSHPENHKYKCQKCDQSFALKSHLMDHLNKHEGIKPYACDFCDKSFQHHGTLKDHLRTHTGEKPFLCPQCGKAFQNSSNMRQHLLRHTGEKRYQCPECPSKFACLSDQIKHMSMHNKIKPHVCDICGSSFTRSYTLTKHKIIHNGQRPHKCEECHMTFVFIDHLRRHLRTHTGEKPYKCKYCERAYAESGDLNKHLRSHVGEKTYICEQCPEAFKYLNDLRAHVIEHYKAQLAVQKEIDNTENEVAVV